jgi:hypothetical protein
MVSGFNSRVVCDNVEYHVQTEDLGHDRSVILTLVYRGGAIVLREKFDYRDILGGNPSAAQVKTLMEVQHRRIMRRAEAGQMAPDLPLADPPPPPPDAPETPRAETGPWAKTVEDLIAEYLRSRRQARSR